MSDTQRLAHEWAIRAFGVKHVTNASLRTLRIMEEATELAQAASVPKELLHKLIDIVYERPVGDFLQEIGGVLMTVYILCSVFDENPEDLFLNELSRVLAKPPEFFKERNEQKIAMGLFMEDEVYTGE